MNDYYVREELEKEIAELKREMEELKAKISQARAILYD